MTELISMFEFLTPMPRQTETHHFHHVTGKRADQKRMYEQRCREVEHASFTPLVMSATGGLAKEADTFYKRLASLLSTNWDHPYSSTLCWLRCRLCYALQSCPSGELDHHVDMQSRFPQQLISSTLSPTSDHQLNNV